MSRRAIAITLLGLIPAGFAAGQTPRPADAAGWLNLMANAPAQTAFSGVYIHQYGGHVETTRLIHAVDSSGEHEKLESMDGPAREVIRTNTDIVCYLPDAKVIKYDRKRARRFFPAMVNDVPVLLENYTASLGAQDRVAGFECQWVKLEPKDGYRFGHRFCAEANSGLVLRAMMLSSQQEVLEQYRFTQIVMGSSITSDLIKSEYADKKGVWQTDDSSLRDVLSADSGWSVKTPPAGFRKVLEVKRRMTGKPEPAVHQIYSDGLAAVSVFIEPPRNSATPPPALLRQGSYNFYVRNLPDHLVTVVGEVPQNSLKLIGDNLTAPERR
jgi:sigma-E factor negative regulatory protein RseB